MTIELRASVVLRDRATLLVVLPDTDGSAWDLPGGPVLPGEAVQEAARRLVLAQTGVRVALANLVGVYTLALSGGTQLRAVFTAYAPPERTAPGQGLRELRWVDLQELAAQPDSQLASPALIRRIVDDVRAGYRYPLSVLSELS